MTEKRRLVVNTLANGIGQIAAMASAFVFMPFLVRSFGMQDYGLYLLAGAVSGYAALLDFGVGTSLVKMVAERGATDNHRTIGDLASTAVAFYAVVGVVAAAFLVTMGIFADTLFHVTAQEAVLLRTLFFIAAAVQVWAWPAAAAAFVLAGFQRYTTLARVGLGLTLANAAATLIVILTHQGPVALMLFSGLITVSGGTVNVLLARRELHGSTVSLKQARWSELKAIFTFSWAVFVVQIAGVVLFQQTDRLVLGIFVGASAITLYEAAGKFQGLTTQLTGFATSAVMPMASHLDAQDKRKHLENLFIRGSKYTAALITPVVVTLLVLAQPLLRAWLGPTFVSQALAAQILVFPQLFLPLGPIGDSIITAQGKLPKRLPYVAAITAGNLILSLLLVRRLGILAVVIGTAVPYLIDFPFHMRFLLRNLDVGFQRWMKDVVVPIYPLLLVPLVLSLVAVWKFAPYLTRLRGVGLAALISIGAYWVLFYFLGLRPREREEVMRTLTSFRDRVMPVRT